MDHVWKTPTLPSGCATRVGEFPDIAPPLFPTARSRQFVPSFATSEAALAIAAGRPSGALRKVRRTEMTKHMAALTEPELERQNQPTAPQQCQALETPARLDFLRIPSPARAELVSQLQRPKNPLPASSEPASNPPAFEPAILPQPRGEGLAVAPAGERSVRASSGAITLHVREIGRLKPLSRAEESSLVTRCKQGDRKAREELTKAKLRLVVRIARDYEGMGLSLLDLISKGNAGLLKAIERFEPASGRKFSARSSWWIRHSIKQALSSQGQILRLPGHMG